MGNYLHSIVIMRPIGSSMPTPQRIRNSKDCSRESQNRDVPETPQIRDRHRIDSRPINDRTKTIPLLTRKTWCVTLLLIVCISGGADMETVCMTRVNLMIDKASVGELRKLLRNA